MGKNMVLCSFLCSEPVIHYLTRAELKVMIIAILFNVYSCFILECVKVIKISSKIYVIILF